MSKLTVINDIHAGAIRSGGTTPKTAWALRQYILQRLDDMLQGIKTDVLILGDLLDAYAIPYNDLFEVYGMLRQFVGHGRNLYLVPGNHDLSKTTTTMSSFQFLSKLLSVEKGVYVMNTPGRMRGHDGYVIPHCINQEQFDIELGKVPDDVAVLYLHCNFDNKFAQKSDHSLNLSADQALKLPVKHIVFAHEHQRKKAINGKVQVIGNQIPSSVADCLGNSEKYLLEVDGDKLTFKPVWAAEGSFQEVDWHDVGSAAASAQFVRVVGDAAGSEASAVVNAISKLRSKHEAFVITNAVKIEGRSTDIEARSLEQAQNFDVREQVMKRLNVDQRAVVEALLAEYGEE